MMKMTGTTICGLVYEGGVILGADTRATMKDASGGAVLIDPNCSKINRLSEKVFCCGAGSAADMKRLSRLVETYLQCELSDVDIPVTCPVTLLKRSLYKHNGYLMCAFIVGGVDTIAGGQIFSVHQHGSSNSLNFCSMGTGLQPSIGVLECGWRKNLSEQDGLNLMVDAVTAGILYDLGSGSNVDITIIRQNGEVSEYKPYKVVGQKMAKCLKTVIPVGTTKILSTTVVPIQVRPDGSNLLKRQYMFGPCGDELESKRLKLDS